MGSILSIFSGSAATTLPHPVEHLFNRVTRYQWYTFFWIFSCKWPLFLHMLNHMVLSPKMDFFCLEKMKPNASLATFKNVCPCKAVKWDTKLFTRTTHTKYGLFCDKNYLISLSKSMVYVGLLFGVLMFGMLADWMGRLPAVGIALCLTGLSGCLVPFMPEIISFCLMRLIEGMGTGGATVVTYVIVIEYCGPSNREAISALFHIVLNISHCSLALISYLLRDCDHAMFAMSIPCILFGLIIPFAVHESPKWLVDIGNIEKASTVMKKICKFNKKPCEDMKSKMVAFSKQRPKAIKKVSMVECFRHKQIVLNFISMACLYFTCGLAYYGVSQFISEMSADVHFNIAISGAALLPGTVLCVILLKVMKRKPFVFACLMVSAITFFICIFTPQDMVMLRVIIACISNCAFFMLFIIVFLYGCEIFPTNVRNSMLGLLSLISRIGQIMAPTVNSIQLKYIECIFPVSALVSAMFLVFPPETKNIELPSTLEEALAINKKKSTKGTQT